VGECWVVIFFAVETQSTNWLVKDDRLGMDRLMVKSSRWSIGGRQVVDMDSTGGRLVSNWRSKG
jgi:hypothetical protein